MRIRRISLWNFGGVEESEVTFQDGVTVIEGDNEAGKTSLLRALDAIIEFPDSSKNQKIVALAPVGRDVGPEVEVEIQTGDYVFTYRKRWRRDTETVLEITAPSHEQLTGRDAHVRVEQILADTLDKDLWKALRLDQGTSLEQASFEGSAIGRALDAASGVDAAGDEEDALWERIDAEYSRYWTKTGKRREDVASAERELDEARQAATTAREHLHSLDAHAAEIERLTEQVATLEQVAVDSDAAVEELEESRAAITEIRQHLAAAIAACDLAEASSDKAAADAERRTEQVEMLAEKQTDLGDIEAEATGVEPERDRLAAEANTAAERAAIAKAELEKAVRAREGARRDAELRRWEIEVTQLTGRRDRVDDANKAIADATAVIEGIAIDEELLAEIEAAYLRVVELRSAVDRALPVIRITAMRDLTVDIDGIDVELASSDEKEVTTHGRTEVTVPDTIGFIVTAGSDGTDIVEELIDAEQAFTALCERGGVPGFKEAREKLDRSNEERHRRDQARETITRDLDDLTMDELSHKVIRLTTKIAEYLGARADEPPLPADHSTAQVAEIDAENTLVESRDAVERASQLAEATGALVDELEKKTAGREGKLEIVRNAVESAGNLLEAARKERSDDAITAAVTEAAKALEASRQAVETREAELQERDADRLDTLLDNARARRKRSRDDLADVLGARTTAEIELRVETERGPAKLADEAESRLVEADRQHDAIMRRANAVALLRSTFERHRNAAHRRYIQPFRDEIMRLGGIVYGSTFDVGLAEDLSIETRTLSGQTLSFGQLSTGAQEQLGVLSRLACARLVSDDGGVPVVLDDALGWTDPSRLDLMGAAISSAADDCQVIILTCMPERYVAVGKARTVRV